MMDPFVEERVIGWGNIGAAAKNCHSLTSVDNLILAIFITITAEYMDALSAA